MREHLEYYHVPWTPFRLTVPRRYLGENTACAQNTAEEKLGHQKHAIAYEATTARKRRAFRRSWCSGRVPTDLQAPAAVVSGGAVHPDGPFVGPSDLQRCERMLETFSCAEPRNACPRGATKFPCGSWPGCGLDEGMRTFHDSVVATICSPVSLESLRLRLLPRPRRRRSYAQENTASVLPTSTGALAELRGM